jgi:hypothetical protein
MKHIPAFCFGLALTIAGNAYATEPCTTPLSHTDPELKQLCEKLRITKAQEARHPDPHVNPEAQRKVLAIDRRCRATAEYVQEIASDSNIVEQVFWDCMRANGLEPPDD